MFSLNLLPEKEKTSLRREMIFQLIIVSLLIGILGLAAIGAQLFFAKRILQDNLSAYQVSLDENKELIEKIKKINIELIIIDEIQKDYLALSPILTSLAQITPNNTQINSFTFNKNVNHFLIRGWAEKRADLLKFENNLKNSDFFTEIESPLSNLLKQENINFEFSGRLFLK